MSEYERHAHRVQTAIAARMGLDPENNDTKPKHLRVGIDMSKSDMCGLARLLIAKGVFTESEYIAAITQAAADEADMHERELQSILSNRNVRTL